MGSQSHPMRTRRFMAAALRLARHHLGDTHQPLRRLPDRPRRAMVHCRRTRGHRQEWPPACRGSGACRGRRAGARRDRLCHPRTLLASRQDAALRRCAGRLRRCPRRHCRSSTPTNASPAAASMRLRDAGIAVDIGVLPEEGHRALEAYLMRQVSKRPHVTLKLAVSADGMIGRKGAGQVRITGPPGAGSASSGRKPMRSWWASVRRPPTIRN